MIHFFEGQRQMEWNTTHGEKSTVFCGVNSMQDLQNVKVEKRGVAVNAPTWGYAWIVIFIASVKMILMWLRPLQGDVRKMTTTARNRTEANKVVPW